jgi:hypothetical protein
LITRDKCSISFGDQCPDNIKKQVKGAVQVQGDGLEEKYLGLPTPDGRMHKGRFQNLQEGLTKRILMWDQASQARKEVLIKTIGQAIPTYLMGVLKLPMSVYDDLRDQKCVLVGT